MACWRCVICFVFVALTLKSLLSHINTAHSRSPDFRVICGVDGCAEDYRVFNSFYHHLRRTHPQYFATGNPPTGWLTASSDANVLGGENFGTAIFADYTAEPRQTVSDGNGTEVEPPPLDPPVTSEVLEEERQESQNMMEQDAAELQTPRQNQVMYFMCFCVYARKFLNVCVLFNLNQAQLPQFSFSKTVVKPN